MSAFNYEEVTRLRRIYADAYRAEAERQKQDAVDAFLAGHLPHDYEPKHKGEGLGYSITPACSCGWEGEERGAWSSAPMESGARAAFNAHHYREVGQYVDSIRRHHPISVALCDQAGEAAVQAETEVLA